MSVIVYGLYFTMYEETKSISIRQLVHFKVQPIRWQEAFLVDVVKVSWERVVNVTNDIDSMVKTWPALFSSIIEKHAPIGDMSLGWKLPLGQRWSQGYD